MSDKLLSRERYSQAFWQAHHEVWRHRELNHMGYSFDGACTNSALPSSQSRHLASLQQRMHGRTTSGITIRR
jgi:hypothetical protein